MQKVAYPSRNSVSATPKGKPLDRKELAKSAIGQVWADKRTGTPFLITQIDDDCGWLTLYGDGAHRELPLRKLKTDYCRLGKAEGTAIRHTCRYDQYGERPVTYESWGFAGSIETALREFQRDRAETYFDPMLEREFSEQDGRAHDAMREGMA